MGRGIVLLLALLLGACSTARLFTGLSGDGELQAFVVPTGHVPLPMVVERQAVFVAENCDVQCKPLGRPIASAAGFTALDGVPAVFDDGSTLSPLIDEHQNVIGRWCVPKGGPCLLIEPTALFNDTLGRRVFQTLGSALAELRYPPAVVKAGIETRFIRRIEEVVAGPLRMK